MTRIEGPLARRAVRNGRIDVDRLLQALGITGDELASTMGLNAFALPGIQPGAADRARLCQLIEIVDQVTPWSGTARQAYAWYRSQPLPSFGDRTAADLVRAGRAADLERHLRRIAAGGYA